MASLFTQLKQDVRAETEHGRTDRQSERQTEKEGRFHCDVTNSGHTEMTASAEKKKKSRVGDPGRHLLTAGRS